LSTSPKPLSWLVPAIVTGSSIPLVATVGNALLGNLGANPIATVLNQLGLLALLLIFASLTCTPLKIVFGWNWPIRIRRALGLYGACVALLHFLTYAVLDQLLMLRAIFADVAKRPFIFVGFTALVLLAPVAFTSTKAAVQRMGFKRWKLLHRLVYVIALLGVVHFYLRVKADTTEPLIFGGVLAVLLGIRVFDAVRNLRHRRARRNAPETA
jgi:methionine sulfoxide reductase heme-binding subunit